MSLESAQADVTVPVLIVGGGPAGLAAALCLAKRGIRPLLVTKHRWTANSPRAHITNQRTVEIFRDLGIEERVLATATPAHLMGNNVWATSFAGREIARLLTWGNALERKAEYEAASPSPMCNIPQHLLEPILAEEAMKAGAELRFGQTYLSMTQDAGGVTARIRDRLTGHTYTVRAGYVIGADGGNSAVVDELGLPLEGQMNLGAAVNVWLKADLTRYCAHRPGVLYWMTQPGNDYWVGSGTFICVRPWTEWVLLFMYDPREGDPDLSVEAVTERAHRVIGDDTVGVDILATSKWQINSVSARRYSEGRVFCAGDAVHRHPPANGLGTNTSIQDSYNLAWKLALVVDGKASPALLESYSAERQPVGAAVVDRAMRSVAGMAPIAEALGFRPGQSADEGWANLDVLAEPGARGRAKREALAAAIALQNYQFNCHGVELGQRYRGSAVIPDGTSEPAYVRDPELYYQPTTYPGARLPHAWLDRAGARVSVHDIVGKGGFTVLTGLGGEAWREAATAASARFGLSVRAHGIGEGLECRDVLGDWNRLREIEDDGCLLVRPDAHIAWRSATLTDDPSRALQEALERILFPDAAAGAPTPDDARLEMPTTALA